MTLCLGAAVAHHPPIHTPNKQTDKRNEHTRLSPSAHSFPLSLFPSPAMVSLALPPALLPLQIPLILATNILTLALNKHNRFLALALGFPLLVLLVSQSLYREWEKGWGLHYGINCFIMTVVFAWVEWVGLGVPDREGWGKVVRGEEREKKGRWERDGLGERIGAVKEKGDGVVRSNGSAVVKTSPEGFGERLWWAVRLSTTNRYVGWSCEAKNVPLEVGPEYPRL